MIRNSRYLACLLLVVASYGCGTSTQLTGAWSEPAYQGQPNQKVLVVALTQNERNMKIWESAFSTALQADGAQPIAGSSLLPAAGAADEAALRGAVKQCGADLLAVTRLLAVDKEQEYVPGSTYYSPAPSYYGYYGYYSSSYAVVSTPGYIQENTIVKLETNLYDVKTEKLVWSGQTDTLNPESAQDAATSIAITIIDDLVKRKVIRKK
jgi:hypothetical protein